MPESIKVALSADGHAGAPESMGFPTIAQWKEGARQARREGARILAHLGDWTHHGLPEEARAIGQALVEGFLGETPEELLEAQALGLHIVGVLGNHDVLRGLGEQISAILQEIGITILQNETVFFDFTDARVGLLGFDGSLTPEEFAAVEQLDFAERTATLQQATAQRYYSDFAANMNALEEANVDTRIVLTHIPVFPGQYSDTHRHTETYEMTPLVGRRIVESGYIDIVGSGHVHSGRRNPMWRNASGSGMHEGVRHYNVAGQTRLQEGLALMEIVELPCRRRN